MLSGFLSKIYPNEAPLALFSPRAILPSRSSPLALFGIQKLRFYFNVLLLSYV